RSSVWLACSIRAARATKASRPVVRSLKPDLDPLVTQGCYAPLRPMQAPDELPAPSPHGTAVSELPIRRCGRVVLIDGAGSVLLVRYDSGAPNAARSSW